MSASLDFRSLIWYDDNILDFPVSYIDCDTYKETKVGDFTGEHMLKYFPSQSPVWTDKGYVFFSDVDLTTGRCKLFYSCDTDKTQKCVIDWGGLRRLRMMPIPTSRL